MQAKKNKTNYTVLVDNYTETKKIRSFENDKGINWNIGKRIDTHQLSETYGLLAVSRPRFQKYQLSSVELIYSRRKSQLKYHGLLNSFRRGAQSYTDRNAHNCYRTQNKSVTIYFIT